MNSQSAVLHLDALPPDAATKKLETRILEQFVHSEDSQPAMFRLDATAMTDVSELPTPPEGTPTARISELPRPPELELSEPLPGALFDDGVDWQPCQEPISGSRVVLQWRG